MTDRAALLAAILANPDDDNVRLVFADWLDEHAEHERARHIRRGCANPQNSAVCLCGCLGRKRNPCETCQLFGREIDVIPRRLDGESHYVANRGFVCEVRCTAEAWLNEADAILAEHPVRRVRLATPLECVVVGPPFDHDRTDPAHAVRVRALPLGPFAEAGGVPQGLYLRSPATDALCTDFLCGLIPGRDVERAVFDRLWPGVEIAQPSPFLPFESVDLMPDGEGWFIGLQHAPR